MVLDCLPMCPARQPFQHLTTPDFCRLIAGMKHYFLVSITIPDRHDSAPWQWWLALLDNHGLHKKTPAGTQRLSENVWLIERDNGVSFLSHLIYEAEQRKLKHQVRFLMEDEAVTS